MLTKSSSGHQSGLFHGHSIREPLRDSGQICWSPQAIWEGDVLDAHQGTAEDGIDLPHEVVHEVHPQRHSLRAQNRDGVFSMIDEAVDAGSVRKERPEGVEGDESVSSRYGRQLRIGEITGVILQVPT
jgi:hypothetical protein